MQYWALFLLHGRQLLYCLQLSIMPLSLAPIFFSFTLRKLASNELRDSMPQKDHHRAGNKHFVFPCQSIHSWCSCWIFININYLINFCYIYYIYRNMINLWISNWGFRFPVVIYVSFTMCLFIFLFALLYAIICSVNGSISPEESLKFYPLNSLAHCYGNSAAKMSRGWGSGAQSKATLELAANSGLRCCSIAQRGNNKGSRLALHCNAWPALAAKTKVNDLKAGGRIKLQDCSAGTLLTVWFAWIKLYICGDLDASLLVVFLLRTSLNKSKCNKNKYDWLLQTNVGQNYNVVSLVLFVNQLCSELAHQFWGVGEKPTSVI